MDPVIENKSKVKYQKPFLSIVVPAFNEEGNIEKLYTDIFTVIKPLNIIWEIIFIDDGSSDSTWNLIRALHNKDCRVKGLRLSRNFGHQYALFAGISVAKGDAVITMDADLQHPPNIIPRLIDAWNKGYSIVNTQRLDSKQIAFLKRVTSKLFYLIFSFLSGFRLKEGVADFRLFDRSVVEELNRFPEQNLFLRGLAQWVGFNSYTISFNCPKRYCGKTKYGFIRMIKFAWTGLTSFTILPLRIATILGLFMSLFSFSGLLYALFSKFFLKSAVPGWTSLLSYISLLFGVLFLLIGILGEYIASILEQVRGRPRFIVKERIGIFKNDQ